jgi:hypothetical protein
MKEIKYVKFGDMMSRDIVVAYVVLTLGLLVNTGIYMSIPDCKDCTLTTKNGETLSGNCSYLRDMMKPIIEYNKNTKRGDIWDKKKTIQTIPLLEITTTTTTIQCPICPEPNLNKPIECKPPTPCVCEVCHRCPQPPDCIPGLTEEQNQWLLKECRPKDGTTAYQSGCHDCCDMAREYLQVPGRPKFKSRPSPTGWGSLREREELICFRDLGDYNFILNRTPDQYNRSRWGWNDQECKTSVLNIHKL